MGESISCTGVDVAPGVEGVVVCTRGTSGVTVGVPSMVAASVKRTDTVWYTWVRSGVGASAGKTDNVQPTSPTIRASTPQENEKMRFVLIINKTILP